MHLYLSTQSKCCAMLHISLQSQWHDSHLTGTFQIEVKEVQKWQLRQRYPHALSVHSISQGIGKYFFLHMSTESSNTKYLKLSTFAVGTINSALNLWKLPRVKKKKKAQKGFGLIYIKLCSHYGYPNHLCCEPIERGSVSIVSKWANTKSEWLRWADH